MAGTGIRGVRGPPLPFPGGRSPPVHLVGCPGTMSGIPSLGSGRAHHERVQLPSEIRSSFAGGDLIRQDSGVIIGDAETEKVQAKRRRRAYSKRASTPVVTPGKD